MNKTSPRLTLAHPLQEKRNLHAQQEEKKPGKVSQAFNQPKQRRVFEANSTTLLLPGNTAAAKILNSNSPVFHCCNTTIIGIYTALRNKLGVFNVNHRFS